MSDLAYAPAFPKTQNGRTRSDDARERKAQDERDRVACYRAVDIRDGRQCRICGRSCAVGAVAAAERAEHHHIVKRSQMGQHDTSNVIHICVQVCHDGIHKKGNLRVGGDADAKNERGKLAGVLVEKLTDTGWRVVGMV